MMDIGIGTAAGIVSATTTEIIHNDPASRKPEDILEEICQTLHQMHTVLSDQPEIKHDLHETVYAWMSMDLPIRYKGYLAVFMLVSSASTFTVNVSGLNSFTWTPTVGAYNRWRFPEGTTLRLLTPANPSYPIEVLYTNDRES